jgi:hypothetical protein
MEVIMSIRKRTLLGAVLGTILLLGAGLAQAAEFSATMITKAGGKEMPGKVYVKGEKIRNELTRIQIYPGLYVRSYMVPKTGEKFSNSPFLNKKETHMIQIIRPDKKLILTILPEQKVYIEKPFSLEAHQKLLPLTEEQKAKMNKVGTETINGHVCDKYENTTGYQGKSMKVYTWVATDLGVPIKVAFEDGSFSLEYKDIKPGPVPDSLFEAPPGYKKMNIPFAMPQQMPK